MLQGAVETMIAQMDDVQVEHPSLQLVRDTDGQYVVRGPIGFAMEYNGKTITDTYEVDIILPDDFPASPPKAKETGGAIPEDFHRFPASGTACLGAPVEVRRRFASSPTLMSFINDQVIPYLFSYSVYRDYGEMPHGELTHGTVGLLEYYMEFFSTKPVTTLKLLKCLADGFAPPLGPCPCGSGRKLQDCHGPKLDELRPHLAVELFRSELVKMIEGCRAADIPLPEREVLPRSTLKHRERRMRQKQKQIRRRRK